MKGKTNQPLRILVVMDFNASLVEPIRSALAELTGQGHDVIISESTTGFDLVVGPNCWRMQNLDGLQMAMKAARATKREKK